MLKVSSLLSAIVLTLSACGQNHVNTSESKAFVSADQASTAFAIVKSIDYLPFLYIEDGCYARSLYMSMELAVSGIPSSAFYVYGDLRPTSKVNWGYHVAPLLQVGNNEAYILDPAFEKNPLRVSQWIAKNMPADGYEWVMKAGSAYFDEAGRTRQFNNTHMVQNFAEMPAFQTSDIGHACTVMFDYISNQTRGFSELISMRAKLLKRTSQMADALWKMGKLQDNSIDPSVTNSYCKSALRY
jgi:hypothetical protein